MICVLLYVDQGFFELLIAAQAPAHRVPRKVREPMYLQGISSFSWQLGEILAQEPSVPPKVN